jgi:hypothetical protein
LAQPFCIGDILHNRTNPSIIMKRNIYKQLQLLVVTATAVLLFSACNKEDDHYSIGDFIVSFGVVEKTPDSAEGNYLIRLDDGNRFSTIAPPVNSGEIKAGQRVFVNFAPYEDKINPDNSKTIYGKINLIQSILFKDVLLLSKVNNDSIGNDPILVKDTWVTGDSILTVGFNFFTEGSVHYINLADNGEGNGIQKPFVFEFRHHARGDQQIYKSSGYVSFNLNKYRLAGQHKVDFYLRYTNYEGRRIDLPHSISY